MFNISFISFDDFCKSLNSIIKKINNNEYVILIDEYNELIKNTSFEKEYICKCCLYFYKSILNNIDNISDNNTKIEILNKIISHLNDISVVDLESYMLYMDSYIILAIVYFSVHMNDKSLEYFKLAIDFGEKYFVYSKMNYFDALNCAYSWYVYYLFVDKNYNKVVDCCQKVINYYNIVKDDPKYNVKEKESVNICKKYLDKIKNI